MYAIARANEVLAAVLHASELSPALAVSAARLVSACVASKFSLWLLRLKHLCPSGVDILVGQILSIIDCDGSVHIDEGLQKVVSNFESDFSLATMLPRQRLRRLKAGSGQEDCRRRRRFVGIRPDRKQESWHGDTLRCTSMMVSYRRGCLCELA